MHAHVTAYIHALETTRKLMDLHASLCTMLYRLVQCCTDCNVPSLCIPLECTQTEFSGSPQTDGHTLGLVELQEYSDVTLVTEDKKQIKANINILSASSPVFKDLLIKENKSSTIMYLRGIQYSEMESIMQFIYLGEATFYEERMDEFLAVAKSLEIKELCNAATETNDEPEEEILPTDPEAFSESLIEQTNEPYQPPQERRRQIVSLNGKHECEPCQKTFYDKPTLNRHMK